MLPTKKKHFFFNITKINIFYVFGHKLKKKMFTDTEKKKLNGLNKHFLEWVVCWGCMLGLYSFVNCV